MYVNVNGLNTSLTHSLTGRILIVKAVGADDCFMAAAAICCCANTILMCISTMPQFFTGYHMWDIPLSFFLDVGPTGSIAMATQLMFVPITAFTKASVLFTYLRIFPSESTRYFSLIMLGFTAAWAVAAFCATLFQCTPVQSYWLPLQYPDAKCISTSTLYYSTGIPNVVSDFAIFLWPAKDLGRLNVAIKQRVTLVLMFCLGIVICVAGVCRLWYSPIVAKSYDILCKSAVFTSLGSSWSPAADLTLCKYCSAALTFIQGTVQPFTSLSASRHPLASYADASQHADL